jgi:transcriptional regulator GlxA family with amidase domain
MEDDALLLHVRAIVRARLSVARPTKAFIARALGLSARTLARRLATRGTTVDRVVQEAREQRSLELLGVPGVGMYEVAVAAGYRNAASFHRAFRAWKGTTPAAYRAEKMTAPDALRAP